MGKLMLNGISYSSSSGSGAVFTGATASTAGTQGEVPAPSAGDQDKYLKGDGTWGTVSAGSAAVSTLTDVSLTSLSDGQVLKYDATNQEWINDDESGAVEDITDLDFSDMTSLQKDDLVDKLNSDTSDSTSGSFTTGSTQYEKVEVNCGFEPDYIQVILPFSSGNTTATYDASVSTTTSTWVIPQEGNTYTITIGSTTGETGITDITSTGFKFRCNASNTRNVSCTFTASQGSSNTYIQTVDFDDISSSQADDILSKLDFSNLTATQISDLQTALGIS